MRLQYPWPEGRTVNPNGKYGPRKHPITGRIQKHRGVDVAGVYPVTAAGDGVVVHIGWSPRGGGHTVIIDHGEVHTVYYHGKHATGLKVGQRVRAGDFIYTSGTTGASTGNHLHFEVRKSRRWGTDVDPMPYLEGAPPKPVLPVTGVPNRATWRAFQQALADKGFEPGRIDGLPGPMTYRAIQRWVAVVQTGRLDSVTRIAVQKKIGVKPDGVWGRITWGEIQRRLNEGTL
jgi:hypothetical protein